MCRFRAAHRFVLSISGRFVHRYRMARTNQHGKGIRRVLGWLVNRDLTDAQMASALGIRPSNYARRKDQDDFPSFEELTGSVSTLTSTRWCCRYLSGSCPPTRSICWTRPDWIPTGNSAVAIFPTFPCRGTARRNPGRFRPQCVRSSFNNGSN